MRNRRAYVPKGMTIADWSAKSGVNVGYLWRIASGKVEGRIHTWEKMATAAGMSIDDLLRAIRTQKDEKDDEKDESSKSDNLKKGNKERRK